MSMNKRNRLVWGAFALAGALALPGTAQAGPPLICVNFQTGGAPSLPWGGEGWKDSKPGYDVTHLVADTIALLKADTPVIARMETLRRASIYASQDTQAGERLLVALRDRALDRNDARRPDPLAWFDFGYLIESYKQAAPMFRNAVNSAASLDGYRHIAKAMTMRTGAEPAMEFAAALVLAGRERASRDETAYRAHVQRANAGAGENALLAANLKQIRLEE